MLMDSLKKKKYRKHKYTHKHCLQIKESWVSKTTKDKLFCSITYFSFTLRTTEQRKTLEGEGDERDLHT